MFPLYTRLRPKGLSQPSVEINDFYLTIGDVTFLRDQAQKHHTLTAGVHSNSFPYEVRPIIGHYSFTLKFSGGLFSLFCHVACFSSLHLVFLCLYSYFIVLFLRGRFVFFSVGPHRECIQFRDVRHRNLSNARYHVEYNRNIPDICHCHACVYRVVRLHDICRRWLDLFAVGFAQSMANSARTDKAVRVRFEWLANSACIDKAVRVRF